MKRSLFSVCLAVELLACGGGGSDPCDPDAPGTICTIAGSTLTGYSGDGGRATEATLFMPMDSMIAPNGDVWFIDFNNYVIRAIDADGMISTVVGTGDLGSSPADQGLTEVPALQAANNHTTTMTIHDGYLYLAAWHESRIKRIRLSDMMMENRAGAGKRTYYDGDGGPAMAAAVDLPASIAFAPSGDLVFTDQANQVIRRIDQGDQTIETIVGRCVVEQRTCQAASTQPVACPGSSKFTCGDPEATCSGPCDPAFAGDGGPATDARLNLANGATAGPEGRIAYDRIGNLLIADTHNHRIRRVAPDGTITTIAGTGEPSYAGDGGAATAAALNRPIDIECAEDGTMYVADMGNSCIRKIDPAGIITTVVGVCSPDPLDRAFGGDGGPPTEARLDRPYGITLAGSRLYVSDSYNNRLRVVNLE